MKRDFSAVRRIVVKVGTSTLTYAGGEVNLRRMELLTRVLSDLSNRGYSPVLVSSGAIGAGVSKLRLPARPADVPGKQAAAAVGQCELMALYDRFFSEYHHTVGQMLLTHQVVDNEVLRINATNTLQALCAMDVIPIVNENDTVAVEEIAFGDNDTLSAVVAGMADAQLLILLTDIDGLYTADPAKDPNAKRLDCVETLTDELLAGASGAGTSRGTGGMQTKLAAAQIAAQYGIPTVIASGEDPRILYDVLEGQNVGTLLFPR